MTGTHRKRRAGQTISASPCRLGSISMRARHPMAAACSHTACEYCICAPVPHSNVDATPMNSGVDRYISRPGDHQVAATAKRHTSKSILIDCLTPQSAALEAGKSHVIVLRNTSSSRISCDSVRLKLRSARHGKNPRPHVTAMQSMARADLTTHHSARQL